MTERAKVLMEAAAMICRGCEEGIPLGSYYDENGEDDYREEPNWKALEDLDNTYRVMEIQHGYDSNGEPFWCEADKIRHAIYIEEKG